MFNRIRKMIAAQGLPPAVQPARGLHADAAFNKPEPGILETLFGWGSDGRAYEMDAKDQRRLRPTYLKSERTIRNEQLAARRAAAVRREPAGPTIRALNDPEPLGGPRPAPYSYKPGQADGPDGDGGASEEARAMAHSNSFVRSAGPGDAQKSNELENSAPESHVLDNIDSTAAMLSGGKRWTVRLPKRST